MAPPSAACILVVDDTDIARILCARVLREAGYEVAEARNGVEALERLRSGACPDLLVTDSNMPVMDGTRLIAEARQLHPGLPIVRISGSHGLSGARDSIPSNVMTLDKPFENEELLSVVAAMLGGAGS
ncbi:MAG TPA: response regulator [Gemmatimonadales bacterium]